MFCDASSTQDREIQLSHYFSIITSIEINDLLCHEPDSFGFVLSKDSNKLGHDRFGDFLAKFIS